MAKPKKKAVLPVSARVGRTGKSLPLAYSKRIDKLLARIQSSRTPRLAHSTEEVAAFAMACGLAGAEMLVSTIDLVSGELPPDMQEVLPSLTYAKMVRGMSSESKIAPEYREMLLQVVPQLLKMTAASKKTGTRVRVKVKLEDMKPDLKVVPSTPAEAT